MGCGEVNDYDITCDDTGDVHAAICTCVKTSLEGGRDQEIFRRTWRDTDVHDGSSSDVSQRCWGPGRGGRKEKIRERVVPRCHPQV